MFIRNQQNSPIYTKAQFTTIQLMAQLVMTITVIILYVRKPKYPLRGKQSELWVRGCEVSWSSANMWVAPLYFLLQTGTEERNSNCLQCSIIVMFLRVVANSHSEVRICCAVIVQSLRKEQSHNTLPGLGASVMARTFSWVSCKSLV